MLIQFIRVALKFEILGKLFVSTITKQNALNYEDGILNSSIN